ncbi:DUF748 domain-containing protein [Rhodoferax fermentans]|uniref:AsmA domain-containing protein n=1 Tax=Rhodoferax fermentans TaxID=28066 RepID=A0A1T1AW42_RHOFE|nr:DUF748 domain-containing protein [Rhodoferax fermentans]MBK1682808.1 DUF748 domain-containing protein [Rhodoferax fermentans]OOV08310.1 hypothetical protein RF819_17780 [Rhodoferax fermentans]
MPTDQANPTPTRKHPLTLIWLRRGAWALVGLLLLWLLSWLSLPPLLKSQAQIRLTELLGRQVTVGQVDFRPWSLELSVSDLAVAGVDAASGPQLTVARLSIDMELQSLLRLAPVVDALVLDSPRLNLTHTGEGRYDVDDVLARLAGPEDAPAPTPAEPLRFALYNLVLSDGVVRFTDGPRNQVHQLSRLQLSVPFLSNLDSKREVLVSPRLAFELNGSQFDSSALATPFAQTRKTDAHLVVKDLDLAPYLVYWPASLPVRLRSAVLDADLQLAFEQTDQTAVKLSGQLSARQLQLNSARSGAELLAFERLGIQLKDVRPLARQVQLGRIELTQPHLTLRRNHAGVLELMTLVAEKSLGKVSKSEAASPSSIGAAGQKDIKAAAAAPATPWQLKVDELLLQDGELTWLDAALPKPAQLSVKSLQLQARALAWPFSQALPFEGSAKLASASLQFKGSATDQVAEVAVQLSELPLALAAPYVGVYLQPKLDGRLSTDLTLNWRAARATQATSTRVQLAQLSLDKLALTGDQKAALASIQQLQLADVLMDTQARSVHFGSVKLSQPSTRLVRDVAGRWMYEDWFKVQPSAPQPVTAAASTKTAKTSKPPSADKPWLLSVDRLQLEQGKLSLLDRAPAQPVRLELSDLSLQLKKLSTASRAPFDINLSTRLRHRHTEPGKLTWRGSGAVSPLALKGELVAERLPLHAVAPYFLDSLNVALLRADAGFKGRLNLAQQPSGLSLRVTGDARLDDLQARSLAQTEPFVAAEELLRWKSLSLSGVDLALAPGVATQVKVAGTVLSDFYARLILNKEGRLNLQDVMKKTDQAPVNTGQGASKNVALASAPAVSAATSSPASVSQALAPVIQFGPISLLQGRINFTDHFIQPNYTADLSELVGKLSAFSSQTAAGEPQLADLELRGRAEGSATLEVLGKINPLVQPMVLDIQGKVRDLELAPLSTYSARYAGYGIERGKLSVDVAYKVQPDGQLTASNQLVLNQLRFGDAVPGATRSLPVKLAVALLADRNGVIDLNVPISGSLNDPQFRLMPIVFKVIGNLILRAVTAPFSLIANLFGGSGGEELSTVSFDAGSALLNEAAKTSLDKVAKVLQERPALKMTVVGTASLEAEREAYKRQQLQALVLGEKRRALPATQVQATATPITVSVEEYPQLLKRVYRRGDFPKPRNLIGLTKDIPVEEMEALLLTHLDASESAMQALALKRGVVVRDYLASQKLPPERLFLGAAKAVSPEAKWQPRAELNLATD